MSLLSFDEVQTELGNGRRHLLLGNGFSIACDLRFSYGSLFDWAKYNGLSERVMAVFEYLGTNNFEGVLRLLEDGGWLSEHYAGDDGATARAEMAADLGLVKSVLVSALTDTHFARPHDLPEHQLARCRDFLRPFHNVFTLNYDLLLYWVTLSEEALIRRDGFGASEDDPDADYCVFQEHLGPSEGILFIHGALHLYLASGEVRKHTWSRTGVPLIDSIRAALEAGLYPLFVAEGMAHKKKEQIEKSSYLSYCRSKLTRIQGPLVVYGWAMGESDQHVLDALAYNEKLKVIYVGLFGDAESAENRATRSAADSLVHRRREHLQRRNRDQDRYALEVKYFDSASASVWTYPEDAS